MHKWMISGISLNLLVTQLLICMEGKIILPSSTSFGVDVSRETVSRAFKDKMCCVTLT